MRDLIISTLRGISYYASDAVRVVNPKQQKLYIKHGVLPVDMYTSISETGEDLLVMNFLKAESKDVYDLWMRHELR